VQKRVLDAKVVGRTLKFNAIMDTDADAHRFSKGYTGSTVDVSGGVDPRAVFSQGKPYSDNSRKGTGTVESV
jgi:hypothetical protein